MMQGIDQAHGLAWLQATSEAEAERFMRVFGTTRVPITSPVPTFANLPCCISARMYRVAIHRLTVSQFWRLVTHIMVTQGKQELEAREELLTEGFGVLDES